MEQLTLSVNLLSWVVALFGVCLLLLALGIRKGWVTLAEPHQKASVDPFRVDPPHTADRQFAEAAVAEARDARDGHGAASRA